MSADIVGLLYLVAGILFILALRGLSSPETSRQGNLFGMVGMAIAIVTTLASHPPVSAAAWAPKPLYEQLYCARGEMENRIKECQLDLFADRTSTRTMRANQLRLWFASMAYVLLEALRRIGLSTTRLARATAGTIRLGLLKIGALVRLSVRRVTVKMASGHPWQRDWAIAHAALTAAAG